MDLLKQSSKYSKYLERINEYKQISDKNKAFSSIESRVDRLFNDIKSGTDKSFYSNIHWGILAITLVMSILCFANGAYFIGLVNIGAAIAGKYLYTHSLKPYINEGKSELSKTKEQNSFDKNLEHKMLYLENGIEIKIKRIAIVRSHFIALFAVIMFSTVLVYNLGPEVSTFVVCTLSALMSTIFWFYFFKEDLDVLEYQGMELDQYQMTFNESNSIETKEVDLKEEKLEESLENETSVELANDLDNEVIDIISPPTSKTQEEINDSFKQLKLNV